MTSIPDLLRDVLGVGRTFRLTVEPGPDGTLLADHPNPESEYDVAVVDGLDRLDERPPEGPVDVEILGRFVDGRIAGRVVDAERDPRQSRY